MPRISAPVRAVKKVEKNRRIRKDVILDKAADLFSHSGYQLTTMEQLSEATGLNKGTIYYYYQSKIDILYDICLTITTDSRDLVNSIEIEDPVERINEITRQILLFFVKNKAKMICYSQEESLFSKIFSKEQRRNLMSIQIQIPTSIARSLNEGNALGIFDVREVDFTSIVIARMLASVFRWSHESIDYIIENTQKLIINSIRR